jgi:ankyrin repeat protein
MNTLEKYPLHGAVLNSDIQQVEWLIQRNISLNDMDERGHSALHWAVFRGDIEIVAILLKAGADPNVFSGDGVTPKWRANDFGLIEIEDLLTLFGGRIDTNNQFNDIAFKLFHNEVLEIPLPIKD